MPVSSDYVKTFSYAVREAQSSGKFDKMMQQFTDSVAPYACSTARRRSLNGISGEPGPDRRKGGGGGGGTATVAASASGATTKSLGLPWTSMIGVFCISVFLQLVALLLWAIERCVGMSFSQMCGCGYKSEDEPDSEYKDVPVLPFEQAPRYEFQAVPARAPHLMAGVDLVTYSPVSAQHPNQAFGKLLSYEEWNRGDQGWVGGGRVGQEHSMSPLPVELNAMIPMMERGGHVSGVGFGQGLEEEHARECADARDTAAGDFAMGANFGNRTRYESPDQPNGQLNDIQDALRCVRVCVCAQRSCVVFARTRMHMRGARVQLLQRPQLALASLTPVLHICRQLLDRQRAHEQSMQGLQLSHEQSMHDIKQIFSRQQTSP